jgi:hypothetical protein
VLAVFSARHWRPFKAYSEYATRCDVGLPETAVTAFVRIDAAATRLATLVDDLLLKDS